MAAVSKRIHQRLEAVLSNLSPQKLEQVADFAEHLCSRVEWEATLELLNDPGMRNDVEAGREQIRRGETRSWQDIKKNV